MTSTSTAATHVAVIDVAATSTALADAVAAVDQPVSLVGGGASG